MNQSVHLTNTSGQDIYVLAAPNPDWPIVKASADATLLFAAVEEIATVTTAAELPEALITISDLFQFLKIAAQLLAASVSEGKSPDVAVVAMMEAFKASSLRIRYGDAVNASRKNFLGMYLGADGMPGILGAHNVSLIVLSDDGRQLCMFGSAPDDSWIVTSRQLIVRSKYHTLWQEDPDAGTQRWPRIKPR